MSLSPYEGLSVPAELLQLVILRDGMDADAGDHLEGTLSTPYIVQGHQPEEFKVGFFQANRYADAKARVRDLVAKVVGGKKADEIMDSVLRENQRRDGFARFWKPNRIAIDAHDMADIVELTAVVAIERSATTADQRDKLIERLGHTDRSDPTAFVRDQQVRGLVHIMSAANGECTIVKFLEDVHAYEVAVRAALPVRPPAAHQTILEEAPYRRLPQEVQEKLNSIRKKYFTDAAAAKLGFNDVDLKSVRGRDVATLSEDQLLGLFDRTKAKAGQTFASQVSVDVEKVIDLRPNEFLRLRQGRLGVRDRDAFAELKRFEGLLDEGKHLRQKDGVLYCKGNHLGAGTPGFFARNHGFSLGFGRRSRKFDSAKRTVQQLVAASLRDARIDPDRAEELASEIMRPWLGSRRALGAVQLRHIAGMTNRYRGLQYGVTRFGSELLRTGGLETLSLEGCLAAGEGRSAFWAFATVHGKRQELEKLDVLKLLLTDATKLRAKGFQSGTQQDSLRRKLEQSLLAVCVRYGIGSVSNGFHAFCARGDGLSVDQLNELIGLTERRISQQLTEIEETCYRPFLETCRFGIPGADRAAADRRSRQTTDPSAI